MAGTTIGYGAANFANQSTRLSGFVVEAPFARTLVSKKFPKARPTTPIPCSEHPKINGYLYLDVCDIPDGTIIQVQTQWSHRGSSLRDGAVFLRMREHGPLIVVNARLPADGSSLLPNSTFMVFSGRADVLDPNELGSFGITTSRAFLSAFCDTEEVEECYDIQMVAEEVAPAPTITTEVNGDGETVVFTSTQAARRVRVRRG